MWTHCKKRLLRFSRPQPGCHLPNSPWLEIIQLFPARERLLGDILAGDEKIANLFFTVKRVHFQCIRNRKIANLFLQCKELTWKTSGTEELMQASISSLWESTHSIPSSAMNTVNKHKFDKFYRLKNVLYIR